MEAQITPDEKFKVNTIGLLTFCNDILPDITISANVNMDQQELITFIEIVKALSGADLITKFIANTYIYWDRIKKRDEKFFEENISSIFGDIAASKISILKYIFTSNKSDPEIKDNLWAYLHSFIKISINHINRVREIKVEKFKDVDNVIKTKISWTNGHMFKEVKLIDEAKKWDIKLY